jgi:hypothetical protein
LVGPHANTAAAATTSGTRLLAAIRPCAHHHLGPQSCFGSFKTRCRFPMFFLLSIFRWGLYKRRTFGSLGPQL